MERVHGSKDSHTHVLGGVMCGPGPCLLHVGGHWVTSPTNSTLTHSQTSTSLPFKCSRCLTAAAQYFFSWLCQAFKASQHQSANLYLLARPAHRAAGRSHRREYAESTPHKCLLVTLLLVKTSLELELVRIELLRVFVCVFFCY